MTTPHFYHAIYLAPHLDDAVLSCGGQIYEATGRGEKVLIVTIMAGDPSTGLSDYAHRLHTRWQLAADAVEVRRREDLAAAEILGAAAQHWPIPDCIYRPHPASGEPLYQSEADIFGEIHPAELPLVADLTARLANLPPAERVLAPLTVGHHVDHQLTRQAAEACFGPRLEYYEDYPYVQSANSLDFLPAAAWEFSVMPVSPAALQARIEAILAYRSQISTFFTDRADLEGQVTGYAAAIGGERLWRQVG
jgi:LmbE family N-acetylglucosaminyl deacetylase